MNRWLFWLVVGVCTGSIVLVGRATVSSRSLANDAQDNLAALRADAKEVLELQTRLTSIPEAADGTDLTRRVSAAVASAGLKPSNLASLSPDAERPVGSARLPNGRPMLLQRGARVVLEGTTLARLGRFLDAWRSANPGWTVTAVDITPAGPADASERQLPLRALITIETVVRTVPIEGEPL